MSFRLKLDEDVADGLKRVAAEQAGDAIGQLESGEDPHEAVHETRKCCKKIRAVLRLGRDALGKAAYKRENACYRDAARRLSELRDSHAVLGLLDEYREQLALDNAASGRLAEELRERRDGLLAAARARGLLEEVAATLAEARARIPEWPVSGNGFDLVAPGLERVYKRGWKGLRATRRSPDPDTVHDWRKRVKYLWYHARLLRPAWPEVLKPYAGALHALADRLGEAHDVVVLEQTLLRPGRVSPDSTQGRHLRGLLDERRARCRESAWPLAERIYAERPEPFVRRLHAYWQAAGGA